MIYGAVFGALFHEGIAHRASDNLKQALTRAGEGRLDGATVRAERAEKAREITCTWTYLPGMVLLAAGPLLQALGARKASFGTAALGASLVLAGSSGFPYGLWMDTRDVSR